MDANEAFLNQQFGMSPNEDFLHRLNGMPTATPSTKEAQDLGDAIIAGLQSSATGLWVRGKLPSMQLGEDAPWYQRLAAGGASIAADLPLSVAGAAVGGAIGTAVEPVGGTVVGAGAGALAVPMALRDGLIQSYNQGHAASWAGAWEIAKASLKGGAKGAVIGGLTAGAGRVVAPMVAPRIGQAVMEGAISPTLARAGVDAAALGGEIATMTTASAALDGHMPTAQDFMDNAILLGGMKVATHIASGMRAIYAETGRTPEQVLGDAQTDPSIKATLEKPMAPGEVPAAYRALSNDEAIKAAIDADPRPDTIRKNLAADPQKPAMLSGVDPADPVKYEYIANTEQAKGVIKQVTALYQAEILDQTRGLVPNKATAIAGMKIVNDGPLDPHVVGAAANAAEIYARAHILRGAANYAADKLSLINQMDPLKVTPLEKLEALAAIERVAMLKAEVEGTGAEAGRALQVFRAIKRDPSYLGDADILLKAAERKGSLRDIAALFSSLKDSAQVGEFARRYTQATPTEKVLELWKAAILSGPQTHLANIAGNIMKWVVEVPENTIAATLTAAQRALTGDPMTMAQWKARAFSQIYGLQMGAKDALTVAGEVWKQHGEHLEKADQYRAAIEGPKGDIIRMPFRALQVEDALFRTVAERAHAYTLAVDRVTKEGYSMDTLEGRARAQMYTSRPEIGLTPEAANKVITEIQQAGAEGVFSQRLGPRMEQVQRAMAGHWSQFIIPFFRTPVNLVSWAIQHAPGLNLMSARWRSDFMEGGEARSKALSRLIIGGGITLTAFAMAESGAITGGGLFDAEQRRTKVGAGWQPYSIKIGDTYYSYQRIEPVAKVIGIAADLYELLKASSKEEDKSKIAAMAVLAMGNATVSTTYLSGLSGVMQAITDPERYSGQFLNQYASSLVPKIIGQPVSAFDPHKREVEGVMDAIQSQLPILREKLMPKRDVWGEPTANNKWFDVMPVSTSEASHDKVKEEAVRLQVALADAPKNIEEKGPLSAKEKRIELTDVQKDIWRQTSGHNAMTILAPIVNSPDWAQIPDFAKAEIFKRVFEGTHKQAAYKALPPEDAARLKVQHQIIDEVLRQVEGGAKK